MTPEEAKTLAFSKLNIADLADRLGITRAAVYQWKRVPVEHCGTVCEMCGWVVTPDQLQPKAFEFLKSQPSEPAA